MSVNRVLYNIVFECLEMYGFKEKNIMTIKIGCCFNDA